MGSGNKLQQKKGSWSSGEREGHQPLEEKRGEMLGEERQSMPWGKGGVEKGPGMLHRESHLYFILKLHLKLYH